MDQSVIGKKVKELRKTVGLTQAELSEGICTQALISQIEKGLVYPSAQALYEISIKLGVDINYFFEVGATPRLDYVQEVERQFRRIRRKNQYREIREIVKVEEKNPLFQSNSENMQLLLWNKGIYLYEVEHQVEKAMRTLDEALHLTRITKKAFSEREIEILLTKGSIYAVEGNLEASLNEYSKVQKDLMSNRHLADKAIKTRFLYNISRIMTRLGKYEESTEHCLEGVRWCIEQENSHLLAELHYHIGYNYELQEDYEEAARFVEDAIKIFDIQHDDKYRDFLINKRKELELKIEGDT